MNKPIVQVCVFLLYFTVLDYILNTTLWEKKPFDKTKATTGNLQIKRITKTGEKDHKKIC